MKNFTAQEIKSIAYHSKVFEALGQESRLKVFDLVCQSGNKGIKPKEIVEQLGIDGGTLHFHLKRLMAVNLIMTKSDGPRGTYYLNEGAPKGAIRLFS
ncbi:winged helix-turn-helix domain-containing protein [Polynucleobacter sp. Nonnen-W13]|uniref:winged helix-turn-helix domain-containing protein n=1 Tax=Polynucleobacter sp. Nonnen-W13 TaxID=1855625 RepID=UPI001C0E29A4|nr:winged helix-turn-helix domain-containing protein [Polynucleobacter sp. Nonnen-W13]MBU3559431.1 winged helix-turn-helix transcriptional regulator [Polynucleobacter sp. Nonnen-W13]